MRFGGRIHQIAQTFDGNVGLLEFLPQPGEAQHRLAHARGEHLEGELSAIPEHHGEKDEQERQVEQQYDGRPQDEFAHRFDALQPCDQGAGGAVFKIRQRQVQQVTEHLAAQHRIDAVAGVQHEVLAQPGHRAVEQHEHCLSIFSVALGHL